MRRQSALLAAGMLALVAAVVLAFLGRAVLATPAAVDRKVVDWPSSAHVASPDRGLADRVAARLVAADRADAFAEIAAIYRDALDFPAAAGEPRNAVRITDLMRRLHSPIERAQALVMAGRLLAFSAGAGFGVALPPQNQAATAPVLAQALEDFRGAIREDPGNETAKYDLELLLRQRAAGHAPPGAAKRKLTKKQATKQARRRKTKAQSGEQHHAGIYATGSGY